MPSRAEVRRNGPIGGKKALGVSWRLESLHAALPRSRGLVGVFRTIVEVAVLPVFHTGKYLALRRTVAFQLVGDAYSGEQFAGKNFLAVDLFRCRCTRISSTWRS
jgi:hypothetical protein